MGGKRGAHPREPVEEHRLLLLSQHRLLLIVDGVVRTPVRPRVPDKERRVSVLEFKVVDVGRDGIGVREAEVGLESGHGRRVARWARFLD